MKYERPQIVNVCNAVDAIQSIHATKLGPFNDGTEASSPAYEADE
jgi:hypothetical protein